MTQAAQGPVTNVFVSNLMTGTTTLVSATTSGQLSNTMRGELNPNADFFSPDSGSLYYRSDAIDLTSNPPDTSTANSSGQGSRNLTSLSMTSSGTTSLISATPGGQLSDSSIN